ncbi:EAL domain-containing protein [Denitratisoma oestradiolicum]|uniref:Diguanylate cyclase (GGDEF) domain-containing protein n=1 Tax=Denitratisoma oestradiolicum TaxID=311182 RepID=A0A6S6YEP1_9PROT|nr:EAL domain-containing protein [Denitratisoma oestradiolicum]TWO79112.1 hypothetical protein CBW56_16390 [Denitratisoma oestradiolicum]CAB1371026.1 Diguanylate cyclase (GGDEF) domain-containing protein [Denitratisoma oestradiolicum]
MVMDRENSAPGSDPGSSHRLREQFSLLADNMPESFWLIDVAERRVAYVNPAYETIWGARPEELLQDRFSWLNYIHPDDRDRIRSVVVQNPYGGIDEQIRIIRPDGELRWLRLRSFTVGEGDRPHTIAGIAYDITPAVLAEAHIQHLSHFDSVTGLPNRTLFLERLHDALGRSRRHKQPMALATLAIDRFKLQSDNWGYATSDRILAALGRRLHDTLRDEDILGCLGEDHFAMILAEVGDVAHISHAVRRLLEAVAAPLELDGQRHQITASMGVAMFPDDGDDGEALLHGAELALLRALEKGPGSLEFNVPELNERARACQRLEAELHQALAQGEFLLHYQPKVSCQHGRIVALEALIRWQHPQRGLLTPTDFFAALEQTGLVIPVGNWVLRTACVQMKTWMAQGMAPVPVTVNLSARQLRRELVAEVEGILAETGLPAHQLELELTESMLMENAEETAMILGQVKTLGVRLSVGNFGTGYSSLGYLRRFPIDSLKVGRAFVTDIIADPGDASITRAIIDMAHALHLKVAAVGVETEGQLGLLIANHCDEIQGYYFSRPLPADEALCMLTEDRGLTQQDLRQSKREPTLLLVDDEENILSALRRLLRREGYRVLTASSGGEGLDVLARNEVDVIVSDQRMPGMTGVEFLRRVKDLYPQTVRLVLSGYTELQSVTSAINEGAIYKFLTKPWDDEQLLANIREAFRRKSLSDENLRLAEEVRTANRSLAESNARLQALLSEKGHEVRRDETILDVLHEALQVLPWPLLGLDDNDMVAVANGEAEALLGSGSLLLGARVADFFPPEVLAFLHGDATACQTLTVRGGVYRVLCRPMGRSSGSRGTIVLLCPQGVD